MTGMIDASPRQSRLRRLLPWCVAAGLFLALAGTTWAALGDGEGCTGTKPPAGVCYTYYCNGSSWAKSYSAPGTSCNDGKPCTTGDVCTASRTCVGSPVQTDDGNACTIDSCNSTTGAITHAPAPLNFSCADAYLCNGQETCDGAGTCRAGQPTAFDDGNVCTNDWCDPATGLPAHSDVTGNACCIAGSAVNPDDGDVCTVDSCDPTYGRKNEPVENCALAPGGQGTPVGGSPIVAPNPLAAPIPSAPTAGGP